MPRKKHLINVHTSTGTTAPTTASLYLGEIAVQHTPDNPALWIKVGSAETSTTYEKFIGLTEITNIINQSSVLGSGYTYSGIPYVNSSTTIADAFSALTNEVIDDEEVTSAALNDLNLRLKQLSGAVGDFNVDMILGSGYTYSGLPYVDSATSIADAYSAVTDILLTLSGTLEDDGFAIASALNDLNDRANTLCASTTEFSENLAELSGAVADIHIDMILGSGYTYSGIPYVNSATQIADAYSALTNELKKGEFVIAGAVNDVREQLIKLSGATIDHIEDNSMHPTAEEKAEWTNGANSGASAWTAVNELSAAVVDFKVDMILGSGYTYSGLSYINSATQIADAFSALTNELFRDEKTISAALNDLNGNVSELSGVSSDISNTITGLSSDIVALSAATTGISDGLNALSGATTGLSDNINALSAATTGLSAAVVTLSAAVSDIHVDMILGSGYTTSSAIPYVNSATQIADAYSALTNEIVLTERVFAEAVNDLNNRLLALPTITAADEGKVLIVSGGTFVLITPPWTTA